MLNLTDLNICHLLLGNSLNFYQLELFHRSDSWQQAGYIFLTWSAWVFVLRSTDSLLIIGGGGAEIN